MLSSINNARLHILEENARKWEATGLAQWRKDLRTGALVMLALLLSMLPWLWYGAACLERQEEASVPAMGGVDGPCVALTFDDGPRRETTTLLLDGLAQRGVHATFFLVGTRVEGKEDIILRMEAEGHQVGIHSQTHQPLNTLGASGLNQEVGTLRQTLCALLGEQEFMLRPPYGYVSDTLCRWCDSPIILWSVDPEDWSDHDVDRQVSAIVDTVKDGDIILLHDIYYASVETALQVVDALLDEGYRFVTVEELFAIRNTEAEAGCIYRSLPPEE